MPKRTMVAFAVATLGTLIITLWIAVLVVGAVGLLVLAVPLVMAHIVQRMRPPHRILGGIHRS